MAHDIDGFAVLRSISAKRKAFAKVTAEVNKAARALVINQMTAKSADLGSLRDVYEALDGEAFDLILDGMQDGKVKTLLNKIDKHHPTLKTSNAEWRRNQVRCLAKASVEPVAKPEPTPKLKGAKAGSSRPKSTTKKSSKKQLPDSSISEDLISFSSAGVTRKR